MPEKLHNAHKPSHFGIGVNPEDTSCLFLNWTESTRHWSDIRGKGDPYPCGRKCPPYFEGLVEVSHQKRIERRRRTDTGVYRERLKNQTVCQSPVPLWNWRQPIAPSSVYRLSRNLRFGLFPHFPGSTIQVCPWFQELSGGFGNLKTW